MNDICARNVHELRAEHPDSVVVRCRQAHYRDLTGSFSDVLQLDAKTTNDILT